MMRAVKHYYGSSATANPSAGGLKSLNSPIPYLFGGLALLLAIIAVALIILACSRRENNSHESGDQDKKNTARKQGSPLEAENEPRVVVIMAGDEFPRYLARPVIPSSACEQA